MVDVMSLEMIGMGSYGRVYRLSPRRIIKVYHKKYSSNEVEQIIGDEKRGTRLKGSLPILRTISVFSFGRETKGVVKKFVPYNVGSFDQLCEMVNEQGMKMHWDDHEGNFRVDYDGTLWRVDTQWKFPVNF